MHKLLSKIWDKKARLAKADKGFTLIELLVVVVILGVLIAIAIPLYLNYRKGANDAAAESDLRNAISVEEVCYTDNNAYPSDLLGGTAAPCANQKINWSTNTTLTYHLKTTGGGYAMSANNTGGSGKIYCYDSSVGGSIKSTPGKDATAATGCL